MFAAAMQGKPLRCLTPYMTGPSNVLWYTSVATQALFCAYMLWSQLAKKHPIFTAFLAASVLRSLLAIYFIRGASGDRLPLSYTYFWLWSEPILLLLQIGVAFEVHSALWRQYESLVRPVRPLVLFSLLLAIIAAALPLKAELSRFGTVRLQAVMQFEFITKRYISTMLAIFLVFSALLFLIVIRESFTMKLFRHETMLAGYLGVYAVCAFLIDMGFIKAIFVNRYLASVLTLCFVAWVSIFKPTEGLPEDS